MLAKLIFDDLKGRISISHSSIENRHHLGVSLWHIASVMGALGDEGGIPCMELRSLLDEDFLYPMDEASPSIINKVAYNIGDNRLYSLAHK